MSSYILNKISASNQATCTHTVCTCRYNIYNSIVIVENALPSFNINCVENSMLYGLAVQLC